jgi:hypothetical protein
MMTIVTMAIESAISPRATETRVAPRRIMITELFN